jgi:hypothetical protein
MSLCSTGCDLARGWDGGGLGRDWQRLEDSFQGQSRVLGAVLSCSVLENNGGGVASDTVQAIRGDRARPILAISGHYSGAARANIGSRMPILGVRVTGHWLLITGHCYSYRDDNTKYTHLTVCCTAALLRFQLPASLLENSVAHTTLYAHEQLMAHGPCPWREQHLHTMTCRVHPDQTRPDQGSASRGLKMGSSSLVTEVKEAGRAPLRLRQRLCP